MGSRRPRADRSGSHGDPKARRREGMSRRRSQLGHRPGTGDEGGRGAVPPGPGVSPALRRAAWRRGAHAAQDQRGRRRTLRGKRGSGRAGGARTEPTRSDAPVRDRHDPLRSGTDLLQCSRPGTGPSTSPTASNLAREPDVARRATSPWRRRTAGLFHARAGTLPGGWPSGAVPASLSLLSRVSRSRADGGRGRKGQAPDDSEVTPCRRERPGDAPPGSGRGSAGRDAVGLHGNSMAHRAPGRKRQSFQKGVQLSRFTPSFPHQAHTCPRLNPSTALHSGPACHPPWRGASKVSHDSR